MDYINLNITPRFASSGKSEESQYHSVLFELKQHDKSDLHNFLKKVLLVTADVLNVNRVSIWFFNENKSSIYCDYLYLKNFGEYISEEPLSISMYAKYFDAIKTNLFIAAENALEDEKTKELAETYLKPRGIFSMLDIPIHYNNEIIGIVCYEEQENYRNWKREEIDFTTAISTLISTALEIDFIRNKEKDFNENRRFLQTLISNLPGYVYRVLKEKNGWTIQYISNGVYDLTGHKPDELIKNKVLYYGMMVNEEDKLKVRVIISKSLANKKQYKINYRLKTADNKIKWVWEQGRGVYNEQNELIATEGFVTDITDKKLYEEELIRKNVELSALYQFSRSLSRLAEPSVLLEDIGNMLVKLYGRENIYIAIYDEKDGMISYPVYYENNEKKEIPPRKYANEFSEFVIKTRKGIILNENLPVTLKMMDIKPGVQEAKSLIASPLIAGEKVIGVITIQDYKIENSFSQEQLELLTTISSQAAIALENSYLYSEVTRSLKEKEALLQEVHHRVKNNLQVMSSLIKLQSKYINDEKMLEHLKETGSRVQSMAIVHTKLYNSKDYEHIKINEYVNNLIENFQDNYGYKLRNISFKVQIEELILNIDTAIPCGLIINELLSNAVKHAFPDNRKGEIMISIIQTKMNHYKLNVKDNGTGAIQGIDLRKNDSLGIQLINLLTKQLNGTLEINTSPEKGTEFIIIFEEALYKSRK
ncbi:MAG: GAF domain-containing protein [Ignavibacteria bacterium]|nr:GAF domain-containing protein [Ignavibacteria bacterium]